MATANNALRITELDFLSIKENLKNYLRSQTEFQDFDFEGSGMSILLDVLAYNTHYMGHYLNMVGNEMFLDTAQIRQSVVSHAKMINYIPKSVKASETTVNITVTPSTNEDQSSTSLTLEKYTRLLGRDIDGINYQFVTDESRTVSKSNGAFYFANVKIKQGEVVTRQFLMTPTNVKRRFDIPSTNVDTTSVAVVVQESSTNTYSTVYSRYENLLDVKSNTATYFIEENENSEYSVYFGDDVIGKKPKDGNIITITYLDSMGSMTNKVNSFATVQSVGGLYNDNVRVVPISATYFGSEKEAISDVRYRAPYFYTTQNRAVTKQDYETLIIKDYPNIDSVTVWGGQENDPPIYGKVFLSLKPKDNYFLTVVEKEEIKDQLITTRNILTVIPEIVDPEYTYILVRGSVYYDSSLTALSADEIRQYVYASIIDYRNDNLLSFNSTFRKSKLQNYIENSERSITASDINIFLQKRVLLDPTQTKNYTIKTNFPIKKGDFNYKISSYPQMRVIDSNNVERQVFFEEVPESFTGIESIKIVNPGINYTSAPTVTVAGDGTGATATASIGSGRVLNITVTNRGSNYTRATVSLTGGGGSQAVAVTVLQTKTGSLRTYYFKSNGEKVIINPNAGVVNYETGEITLTSLRTLGTVVNDFYDTNELVLNLPIDNEIIPPLRNRILEIDENDALSIQIETIVEQ